MPRYCSKEHVANRTYMRNFTDCFSVFLFHMRRVVFPRPIHINNDENYVEVTIVTIDSYYSY